MHSKADSFENLLEPLQKLLRLSPPVAACLAHPDLFSRTVHKLVQSKKALVRLNLLRIIRSICDASDEDGNLITTYGLYTAIADLAKHDTAILVREMAGDLIKSAELNARRSMDGVRRTLRRSSSSTMTPILSSNSSLPPTPSSDRTGMTRIGSYFDGSELSRQIRPVPMSATSPYRPVSRDGPGASSSSEMLSNPLSPTASHHHLQGFSSLSLGNGSASSLPSLVSQKSRLPRQRPLHRTDRLSMAIARGAAGENLSSIADAAEGNGASPAPREREGTPQPKDVRGQVGRDGRRRRMTSQG